MSLRGKLREAAREIRAREPVACRDCGDDVEPECKTRPLCVRCYSDMVKADRAKFKAESVGYRGCGCATCAEWYAPKPPPAARSIRALMVMGQA